MYFQRAQKVGEQHKMSKIDGMIRFLNYKVTKVEYQLNTDFVWGEESIDVKMNTESESSVSEDGKKMIVTLTLRIFDDEQQKYPFRMIVEIQGAFVLVNDEQEENIEKYYANALSILYPYARAVVSTYTANANIEPLILPTVNIWKMLNL